MPDTLPGRVRFGVFELDLRAGELRQGEQTILLQEQPFQVLLMLVERGGEIATREEIQKKLWPNDTVVEFDQSINAAIKKLRKALGDSAEEPKYIETVARRGYRLMVPVERVAAAADHVPAFSPRPRRGGLAAETAVRKPDRQDGLALPRAGDRGRRRHGGGVPGRRPEAGPGRGAEVPAGRAGRRSEGAGAF